MNNNNITMEQVEQRAEQYCRCFLMESALPALLLEAVTDEMRFKAWKQLRDEAEFQQWKESQDV